MTHDLMKMNDFDSHENRYRTIYEVTRESLESPWESPWELELRVLRFEDMTGKRKWINELLEPEMLVNNVDEWKL